MVADATVTFLLVTERSASPAFVDDLARSARCRPVGRADSVAGAIEAVQARRPEVVVADVVTVERSQQLAAAIPRMAEAKVVVVSSLPAEVALLPSMAAGARAFLHKPLDRGLLERAVASVAAGDTVVDPRSTGWLVELALHGHRARPDSGLTLRQSQVLVLVRSGLTNREIGRVLGLSIDTVKTHLREAMKRLGAADRWTATALADRRREEPE